MYYAQSDVRNTFSAKEIGIDRSFASWSISILQVENLVDTDDTSETTSVSGTSLSLHEFTIHSILLCTKLHTDILCKIY